MNINASLPAFGVVDLFAGPGGLAEGFSAFEHGGRCPFRVELSVENEAAAHRTLQLRAFLREFGDTFPEAYYSWLNGGTAEPDWAELHPDEWRRATEIAMRLELGKAADDALINQRIDAIRRRFGERTILIGGPPCQAYSLVGRARNAGKEGYDPKEDNRHFLYKAYIGALRRLKPAAFVMENVKGMLSSRVEGEAVFQLVLNDLRAEGYRLVALSTPSGLWSDEPAPKDFVIRAEDHGLPQARHRVIVVGLRSDVTAARLGSAKLDTSPQKCTVRDVLAGMPPLRSGLSGGNDGADVWAMAVNTALTSMEDVKIGGLEDRQRAFDTALARTKLAFAGRNEAVSRSSREASELLPSCPRRIADWLHDPKLKVTLNHDTRGHMKADLGRYLFATLFSEATGRSPKAAEFPGFLAPEHANWSTGKFADRFRVQVWDTPATTVVSHISKDGHYFIHPDPLQCRSLTVREAARLQTFPDNYLFLGNRTEQYVQVGNAVPPLLAHDIAAAIWRVVAGVSDLNSNRQALPDVDEDAALKRAV